MLTAESGEGCEVGPRQVTVSGEATQKNTITFQLVVLLSCLHNSSHKWFYSLAARTLLLVHNDAIQSVPNISREKGFTEVCAWRLRQRWLTTN